MPTRKISIETWSPPLWWRVRHAITRRYGLWLNWHRITSGQETCWWFFGIEINGLRVRRARGYKSFFRP